MAKDTTKVLLIAGGVAVAGVILYLVLASPSSNVSYTSGTTQTKPTATPSSSTSLQGAEISVGTSLIDKFFGITPAGTAPSSTTATA